MCRENTGPVCKTFLSLVKLYRFVFRFKQPCCRFYPSCSQYALDALNKYGAIKGSFLTIYRILRCNPFCQGGYDPVLDEQQNKKHSYKGNC